MGFSYSCKCAMFLQRRLRISCWIAEICHIRIVMTAISAGDDNSQYSRDGIQFSTPVLPDLSWNDTSNEAGTSEDTLAPTFTKNERNSTTTTCLHHTILHRAAQQVFPQGWKKEIAHAIFILASSNFKSFIVQNLLCFKWTTWSLLPLLASPETISLPRNWIGAIFEVRN